MSSRNSHCSHALRISESLPETRNGPSPISRHFTLWLDEVFRVPDTGFRFDFSPLLSLIPAAGDATAAVLGCVVVPDAVWLRVPVPVPLQVPRNYMANWCPSSVPLIGSFFDALWILNTKNLKLLHRAIEDHDQVRRATIAYWLVALTLVLRVTLVLLVTPFVLLLWLFGLWPGRW